MEGIGLPALGAAYLVVETVKFLVNRLGRTEKVLDLCRMLEDRQDKILVNQQNLDAKLDKIMERFFK